MVSYLNRQHSLKDMGDSFSHKIYLLIIILLISALLIGCEKEQESVISKNDTVVSPIKEEKIIPEITFYSLECLNNYYEYVGSKKNLINITSSDDQYYYYINYFNKASTMFVHGIFPKCTFVASLNQFSNILNSIRYPCCSHAPLLEIKEKLSHERVKSALDYLFKANNVEEYSFKSITETKDEFFITMQFNHTIKEGNFGGVKTGLAYFKVDKKTQQIYEINEQVDIVDRWDGRVYTNTS